MGMKDESGADAFYRSLPFRISNCVCLIAAQTFVFKQILHAIAWTKRDAGEIPAHEQANFGIFIHHRDIAP